mgnify:CR=1 FL=1
MSGRLPWVAAAVVIVIAAGLAALYLSTPTPAFGTIGLSLPEVSSASAVWTAPGTPLGTWVAITGPAEGADNCAIENIYIVDNLAPNSFTMNIGERYRTYADGTPENVCLDGADDPVIDNNNDTATIPYERPFKIVVAAVLWADADMVGDKGPSGARHIAYVNPDNAYVIINFTGGTGWDVVTDGPDSDSYPDENTQDTGHEYAFENDDPWLSGANNGGQNDRGLGIGWAAIPGGVDNISGATYKGYPLTDYIDYARVNFVFCDTETAGGDGEFQLPAGGQMNIEATLYVWV